MNPILRNVLACIAGILIGSALNMAIVSAGSWIAPLPEGVDFSDSQSLRESMHLLGPRHFAPPFLAHALGTLVGALVAFLMAASRKQLLAYILGIFFFIGGVAASFMIPAPAWFIVLDLLLAYLPMSYLAIRLGSAVRRG